MNPTRRKIFSLVGAGVLTAAQPVLAQSRILRVGYLATASPTANAQPLEAFRNRLRELGYVEGRNLAIEYRWTVDNVEPLAGLASELVALKVDAILAWTTPVVIAARKATTSVPIVMVGVADPVGSGLVQSLAHPGGNITGISNLSADLSSKVVELLVQLVPRMNRIAGVRNAANPASELQWKQTEAAVRKLGMQYQPVDVRAAGDLDAAFAAMTKSKAMAAIFFADGLFVSQRAHIVELATKHHLPTAFSRRENVEAGGLFAYGANLSGQFGQAAAYMDRIFKGAKPADLPVEEPTKLEMVINRKTAVALGLSVPMELLLRADQVIE
jgi:putative ABC transport system substrate-binding protein